MYLTQKNQLRNLPKQDFVVLQLLCRLTKNLYNEGLYAVRQYYFQEKQYLRYESNYHACKSSENYALLSTDIAQQTLKLVDRNFKSFFALIKKAKSGSYQFNQIKLPHYLPKDGYAPLLIPRIRIKDDGWFSLPMSPAFKKEHGEIRLQLPERLREKTIKEVRIHPKSNGRFFEIEYVYEQQKQPQNLDYTKALAIDLGLDNLATCVTSTGASFIIDGKKLKSYNQWYSKENARLQSIKNKQGDKKRTTKGQAALTRKRNRRVNHYMSTATRRIVNYCIDNQIGNLVVGYNLDWKRGIKIGKRNNQNFVQVPYGLLRQKLSYLCEFYGINYVEQEESYTSKASFFDDDDMPVYNVDNPQDYEFSGKRISRGQYRTANNFVFNADCNGALNILRKSNLLDLSVLQNSCRLDRPRRIRIG
jgi:IS605 OrfB family transposase